MPAIAMRAERSSLRAAIQVERRVAHPPSQTTTVPSAWIEIVGWLPRGSRSRSTGNKSSGSVVRPFVGKRVSFFVWTPVAGRAPAPLLGPADEPLDDLARGRTVPAPDLLCERLLVPEVGRALR